MGQGPRSDARRSDAASSDQERTGRVTGSPWWPLLAFLLAAAVTAVLFTLLTRSLGLADDLNPGTVLDYRGDFLLGGRARWDADWYTRIATDGYSTVPVYGYTAPAFFPGYSMAIRLLMPIFGNAALSGIVVNLLAGAGGVVVFYRWVGAQRGRLVARAAVVALLLYPYTLYFYGVVYSEPLFFVAAVGAFWLLEQDHTIAAGLAGAVASGTRLVGVVVAVGLVLRLLERRGVLAESTRLFGRLRPERHPGDPGDPGHPGHPGRRGRLRPADSGVLLAFGGLLAYLLYLGIAFGNPLLFQKSGEAWGQGEGLRTLLKVPSYTFFTGGLPYMKLELVLQIALLLGALALSVPVARQFGRAYGWYVVMAVGVPLVTVGNLYGSGRYVFAAFPVFAVVGGWLRTRPSAARWIATACIAILVISIALYVRGLWVS